MALSTTEAKYVALTLAAKEAIWFKYFFENLKPLLGASDAMVLREDNQSAIALAHNPEFHERSKHINVRYHFIRRMVEVGSIQLEYCHTSDMIADTCTKLLRFDKYEHFRYLMGLVKPQASTDELVAAFSNLRLAFSGSYDYGSTSYSSFLEAFENMSLREGVTELLVS